MKWPCDGWFLEPEKRLHNFIVDFYYSRFQRFFVLIWSLKWCRYTCLKTFIIHLWGRTFHTCWGKTSLDHKTRNRGLLEWRYWHFFRHFEWRQRWWIGKTQELSRWFLIPLESFYCQRLDVFFKNENIGFLNSVLFVKEIIPIKYFEPGRIQENNPDLQ